VAGALLALTLVAGCTAGDPQTFAGPVEAPGSPAPAPVKAPQPEPPRDERAPNIVLVLMDDFSMDLLQTMPSARRMARLGASYDQAYVVDSLCCVSRASLLTGQYPHQTGVRTNSANTPNGYGPVGGWQAFEEYGNGRRSVNVRLQEAGYRTGFIGKYLNEYELHPSRPTPAPPPGWTDWQVFFGSAYDGWDFWSTETLEDGTVVPRFHEAAPEWAPDLEKDAGYATNVMTDQALEFLEEQNVDGAPYFLEIAPFGPHSRTNREPHYSDDPVFPPAFADRPGHHDRKGGNCGLVRCADLTVDDLAGFGDDTGDNAPRWKDGEVAPAWRPDRPTITKRQAETSLRDRARMVQSIDRMVDQVLDAVDDNTYVVLTSDNGFHLGQHGLGRSKGTPYDSDVHVPLLVTGPGVSPGPRQEMVSNIDLAPTFEELAGLAPARYRSGLSLVPTLRDPRVNRRDLVVFEHTWGPSLRGDPDRAFAGGILDIIPSYVAVRGRTGLLVRVDLDNSWESTSYAWEYYDYTEAAYERRNAFADPEHAGEIAGLRTVIDRFDGCREYTRNERVPLRCRLL
jgi:arylsulfatase A-like enzyme